MLVKSSETLCSNDFELYCTLVDKGRLYEYLSEKYKEKTGIQLKLSIPSEKQALKQIIFVTLFSDNRFFHGKGAEMKRFFAEIFPTVYKVFSLFKSQGNELLPITLQMVESEIVLKRAARRISMEQPTIPLYTIHDSIVTTTSNKEYVYAVLKEEFESAIGLMPRLSVEEWRPNSDKQ